MRNDVKGKEKASLAKLSTNGMKNLGLAAGVSYISQEAVELMKKLFFAYLEELVRTSANMATYRSLKTIKKSALEQALQSEGSVLIQRSAFIPTMTEFSRCEQPPTYSNKKGTKDSIKRKIAFVQKERGECVYFSIQGVSEMQDAILAMQKSQDAVTQISEEVRQIMHYLCEEFIIDMFKDAVLARDHAGRSTLMPSDVLLVMAYRHISVHHIERVLKETLRDGRSIA